MAIAITEPTAEVIATTNSTSYAFAAFTPTANSLLIVFHFTPGAGSTWTVSDTSSLTWNRLLGDGSNDNTGVTWAQVGGSPASTTITVTPQNSASGVSICIFQITGHDTTSRTPIRQAAKALATSTNPVITFDTAMGTNNGYCAVWSGQLSGATNSTPPASWTETADSGYSVPVRNTSAAFRAGGETGTTITFTAASTTWIAYGVEIFVAGAGPLRHQLLGIS